MTDSPNLLAQWRHDREVMDEFLASHTWEVFRRHLGILHDNALARRYAEDPERTHAIAEMVGFEKCAVEVSNLPSQIVAMAKYLDEQARAS